MSAKTNFFRKKFRPDQTAPEKLRIRLIRINTHCSFWFQLNGLDEMGHSKKTHFFILKVVVHFLRQISHTWKICGRMVHLQGKQLCHFYFYFPSQWGPILKERVCLSRSLKSRLILERALSSR